MARSGLIFDPATGLYAPETQSIRDGVASDWKTAFFEADTPPLNTEPTTPAGQLIDAEVAEIEAKNAELLYLSNQFNPDVASGRWQDGLGHIYFLTRHISEPTVVTCQLTGFNGTIIPYGVQAQTSDGLNLICNSSVTIGSEPFAPGTAQTTFRVAENGPVEIAAHAVNKIITTTAGWDTIDNATPGVVGRDVETRSEFEARRAASVAANSHGSTGALYGTIANLPGVLDCQVLENIGPFPVVKYGVEVPGHGVTVCVYGGEDADIAEAIYRKKDNGADTGGNTTITYTAADYANAVYQYLILRPTPTNFWIKVTLGAGSAPSPEQIAALQEALFTDFYGLNLVSGNARIGLASTVYASRFYCPALAVEGIRTIQSIEIALSADAPDVYADLVDINGDQEPVLARENITVATA